ncbi:MAG: BON domain-containing protein [Ardenticatenaceae bacterium]|nr:BON domain-containing protein [Ardenticatenaceae bacterium]
MPNEYWRTGRFLEEPYDLDAAVPGYENGGMYGAPTWHEYNYRASTDPNPPFGEDEFYGEPRWTYTQRWMIPGPQTGRGPQGYVQSDERIEEHVCERLTRHGGIDARDIEVSVDGGEVTLSGTVDSRRQKRIAGDVAESVMGVVDVHNRLRLRRRPESQGGLREDLEEPGGASTTR